MGEQDKARERILADNDRRRAEVDDGRYAPSNPAELFMTGGRRRLAAALLADLGVFPREGRQVLEIGCGEGGLLPDLLSFRLAAGDLHGVDLDEARLAAARRRLPGCHFVLADASALPFEDARFDLVIASTVFSSILEPGLQQAVAAEIVRVLRPGGAYLHYDLAMASPKNPHVQGVTARRLRELFPALAGKVQKATLAPPLCRALLPRFGALAALLEALPFLRSHLLAVLKKPAA
jgi:ubiquinone/menaquinone biosynthesis C-methylase UbiE